MFSAIDNIERFDTTYSFVIMHQNFAKNSWTDLKVKAEKSLKIPSPLLCLECFFVWDSLKIGAQWSKLNYKKCPYFISQHSPVECLP